jgi:hypothetical protein
MTKLTQSQLLVLLQLRRAGQPLTKLQLGAKGRTLDALFKLGFIEIRYQPIAAKITTEGLLTVNDYIRNNPVELPEKRSYLQEHEVYDLVSLYYPNESLYLLMKALKEANFEPIFIGADRMYTDDKVRKMFEFLRNR